MAETNNKIKRLKKIFSTILDVPKDSITQNTKQENIGSWDSLNHLQLIMAIEQEFKVKFDIPKIPSLTSFTSIIKELNHVNR